MELPFSEAVILSFTTPIWTTLIATLWLKEKWSWVDIAGMLVNLLGVLFVARPAFLFGSQSSDQEKDVSELRRLFAIGIGLLGAVFASFAYVTVRFGQRKIFHLFF